MVNTILVAELEVTTTEVKLDVEVHEWNIYTKMISFEQFQKMFYAGEGDLLTFSLSPSPPRDGLAGFEQGELERQGWIAPAGTLGDGPLTNYFQLGGRRRNNSSVASASAPIHYGNSEIVPTRADISENELINITENAYFIGDPGEDTVKSFWSEEIIMNQMEYDLGIARDRWTSSSKHRITEELEFLTLADGKIRTSRDLDSIALEIAILPDGEYDLLISFIVTNPALNILDNNLNIHFRCIK
jgi:hypothetical protein